MPTGFVTKQQALKGGSILADAINRQAFVFHPWQRVLYVQSGHRRATDLRNDGQNPDAPLATLVKALSLAQAHDFIMVGPAHTETMAGVTTISVSGLTIVGMGNGAVRPYLTIGTATTDKLKIAASNIRIANFNFAPGIDSLAVGISFENSASDCIIEDCYFEDPSSIQALKWIDCTAGTARCKFQRLTVKQTTAGAASFIDLGGTANDQLEVIDCNIRGNYSVACISIDVAVTNLNIGRNNLHNLNATSNDCINFAAVAATGYVFNNLCRNQTDADVGHITMGAGVLVSLFNNYGVNNNQETGLLLGTPSA